MASLRHLSSIFLLLTISFIGIAQNNILDRIPSQSSILEGYDYDVAVQRFSQMPHSDIEGIWQFLESETIIAIEKFNPEFIDGIQNHLYRIIIIKSPRLSIEPGTIMGYAATTAKKNCFDARLYSDNKLSGVLSIPKTFTLNLSDDSLLSFNEYKTEIKVNLWRWIPYIYRVGVSINNTRPKGLDGCVRLFPKSITQPVSPRFL